MKALSLKYLAILLALTALMTVLLGWIQGWNIVIAMGGVGVLLIYIGVSFKSPVLAVSLAILLFPFNHLARELFEAGGLPVIPPFHVAILLAAVGTVFRHQIKGEGLELSPLDIAILGLAVVAGLSVIGGRFVLDAYSIRHILTLYVLVGSYFLLRWTIETPRDFWRLYFVLCCSLIINSLAALLQVTALGTEFFSNIGYELFRFGETVRPSGFAGWPNEMGIQASQAVVLVAPLIFGSRVSIAPRLRYWATAIFLFGLAGVVMSLSRSSWLALGISVVFIAITMPVAKTRIVMLVCSLGVAIAVVAISGALPVVERVAQTFSDGQVTYADLRRLDQITIVHNIVQDRPFFGVGWGQYSEVANLYRPDTVRYQYEIVPHAAVLKVASEAGLFGLLAFSGVVVVAGRQAVSALRSIRDDSSYRPVVSGIVASLIGFGMFSLFQPTLYEINLWLTLGFLGGISSVTTEARYLDARA